MEQKIIGYNYFYLTEGRWFRIKIKVRIKDHFLTEVTYVRKYLGTYEVLLPNKGQVEEKKMQVRKDYDFLT